MAKGIMQSWGLRFLPQREASPNGWPLPVTSESPLACLHFCRMGLTLHQSGHGHSHDTSQQQENLSVRAAFIHVIGDFLQSLGILVAAYVVYFKVRAGDRGK